jgi:hypothetical protein
MFDYDAPMKSWELEQLRRSVVMLPPGHSAGAVSKAQAEELLAEIDRNRGDIARYRKAVDELRRVLAVLESELATPDQTT